MDMLRRVRDSFDRMIVLLNVGNIIDMSFVTRTDPDAVLYVWQGGMVGGLGVVDVLTGRVSPSGHLTDTIAKSLSDYPSSKNFGSGTADVYEEDIYVGYRYFESVARDRVLYPFGYGLTYGDVRVRRAELVKTEDSTAENGAADRIRVTYDNDSAVDTKDVIQVYVEPEDSPWKTPNPRLCGFLKISAPAGKTCECEVILDEDTFKVVNDEGERVSGGDHYKLYVGTSMPDKKSITLTGKEPLVLTV
jgi:beta-glucosidase